MARTTFSGPVDSDNGFILPAYTVATQPDATAVDAGTIIYVSDGLAGAPTIAVSNGTIWASAAGTEIAAS